MPMRIATTGCRTRRRVSQEDVDEKSSAIPSITDSAGKRVSARAVTAPVAAISSMPMAKPKIGRESGRSSWTVRSRSTQYTTSVRPASRIRVFTRWMGTEIARASEASFSTHSKMTITAPISDSERIPTPESTAAFRTGAPRWLVRKMRTMSQARRSSAIPDEARCVNSMAVAPSNSGRMTPSQVGHDAPHPAPDPVARTSAPSRITIRFQTSAVQASRRVVNTSRRLPERGNRPDSKTGSIERARGGPGVRRAPRSSQSSLSDGQQLLEHTDYVMRILDPVCRATLSSANLDTDVGCTHDLEHALV